MRIEEEEKRMKAAELKEKRKVQEKLEERRNMEKLKEQQAIEKADAFYKYNLYYKQALNRMNHLLMLSYLWLKEILIAVLRHERIQETARDA